MKTKTYVLFAIVLVFSGLLAYGIFNSESSDDSPGEYPTGRAQDINLTLAEMKVFNFSSEFLRVSADGQREPTLVAWTQVKMENCEGLESFSHRYFYPVYFWLIKREGTGVTVTVYKDPESARKCFDEIHDTFNQPMLYTFVENPIQNSDNSIKALPLDAKMFMVAFLKGNVIGRIQTSCDSCALTIAEKLIDKISAP